MAKPPRARNTKGNVEREFDMLARAAQQARKTYDKYLAQLQRMGIEGRHMVDAMHVQAMMYEHSLIEGREYDIKTPVGRPRAEAPIEADYIRKIFEQVTPSKKHKIKETPTRKAIKLDDVKSTRPQVKLGEIKVEEFVYEVPEPMPGITFSFTPIPKTQGNKP
ncbi:hypothetical protein AL527_14425 [Pseudomonas fulva]|uniref:hypothetical protein n=1 Tax=Pseudomonas fulva TaxID=47880 RepID=UPI000CE9937D|nr:hypothetical protein [Pseudomonas fulva]AVF56261.1 hypothetical protein AL527_14425 [Pseudomonas fulva]